MIVYFFIFIYGWENTISWDSCETHEKNNSEKESELWKYSQRKSTAPCCTPWRTSTSYPSPLICPGCPTRRTGCRRTTGQKSHRKTYQRLQCSSLSSTSHHPTESSQTKKSASYPSYRSSETKYATAKAGSSSKTYSRPENPYWYNTYYQYSDVRIGWSRARSRICFWQSSAFEISPKINKIYL